jgi:opacity protein-like surface antigen
VKRGAFIILCAVTCGIFAVNAYAQADIGLKGAGPRLSFVSPNHADGTIGFGALVDLGEFTPELGFEGTFDMWFSSDGPVDFSSFIFGARTKYTFEVQNPDLKPYAAGGLALHFFHSSVPDVTVGNTTFPGDSKTDTKLGLDLGGGLAYKASPKADVVGELMYRIVSDVGQLVLSAGVVFWFD